MTDSTSTANSLHPERGVHLGDEPRNGPLERGAGRRPGPLSEPHDDWDDLRERLQRAERELRRMASEAWDVDLDHREETRLSAKASGVSLALSYMADYERSRVENGS